MTKKLLKITIMIELNFLCKKKILGRLKQETTFALTCLVTKMGWLFQFTFQIKKFGNSSDLSLITDDDKPHYVYIKHFDRFMFHKTKNTFVRVVCSALVVKMCWQNIKKVVWALMVTNLEDWKKEPLSLKIILNKYHLTSWFLV